MPHEDVTGLIAAAVKALLVASGSLTALIGTKSVGMGGGPAIYDEGSAQQDYFKAPVGTAAPKPYLTIGAWTQVPDHSMGPVGSARFAWNCTGMVKVVGQGDEASGVAIRTQIAAVLYDGRDITLAGYTYAWTEEFTGHPTIVTLQAGVTTREWPAIVRVKCSDI